MNRSYVVIAILCFFALSLKYGCHMDYRSAAKESERKSQVSGEQRRVVLSPFALKYYEGERVLEFPAEMGEDEDGAFFIVYLPTPARWRHEMPEWARDRRSEIIHEIKGLTKKRTKWVED